MRARQFTWRSSLPYPASAVFAWYERVGAFERLNAPWRPVSVISPSQPLALGTEVDIRVPVFGPVCIPWRLRHSLFVKNEVFRDEQIAGPFKSWKHDHKFIKEDNRHTTMLDEIEYALPWIARVADFHVRRELNRLFAHRHAILRSDLELHARWQDKPRKSILIAGGSGFIGSALRAFLNTAGHRVLSLVRRPARDTSERAWYPDKNELSPSVFEDIDVVINLGGENIADKRWSESRKAQLWKSRTQGTALLARTIASLKRKPELVIMGSAVGFYGNRGSEILDEQATAGRGFLAELARAWEGSALPLADSSCRLACIRIGTVLNVGGGALQKMVPAFLAGVGGPLGGGQQYMSWIALQDLLGAIEHIIYTPSIVGPINLVAPEPCANNDFSKTLGQVLRRPSWSRMPEALLRGIFGEIADEALLASCRVIPSGLLSSGYQFVTPELREALVFECGLSHRA